MARANSNRPYIENGLPILGEDDEDLLDLSNSAYKRNPPLSNRSSSQQSRRTPTPTKQISLTAVKRKEDSFYQEDDQSIIDELKQSMKLEAERSFVKEPSDYVVERNTTSNHVTRAKKPPRHNCSHNGDVETAVVLDSRMKPEPKKAGETSEHGATAKPPEKKPEKRDDSSSSGDSSDEEEEERKAPNQLLMEFLECIYAKDYPTAAKLCKMILIYEPDHPVALQFQPVIAEKIQQDIEAEEEGSDDDEEGDSGEEDDSDDDSDDDDSDDSDSGESTEEEEEDENDDSQNSDSSDVTVDETGDSGIASTESSDRDFYEM